MKVAVAVIYDEQQRVLITKRPEHVAHGGMWEFPGGKLEKDELPFAALIRELKEEVDIDILEYSFLDSVLHHYEERTVDLLVFLVKKYHGKAACKEAQSDLRWVNLSELDLYNFPAANKKIIKLLKTNPVFQIENLASMD